MSITPDGQIHDELNHPQPPMPERSAPGLPQSQDRPANNAAQPQGLKTIGQRQARRWVPAKGKKGLKRLKVRWDKIQSARGIGRPLPEDLLQEKPELQEHLRWIQGNARFIRGVAKEVAGEIKSPQRLPCVISITDPAEPLPRAYRIAANFLQAVGYEFAEDAFGEYLSGVQQVAALEMGELWALKPLLQLVLLEQVGASSEGLQDSTEQKGDLHDSFPSIPSKAIASLHTLSRTEWQDFFEANCLVDHVLRSDPSGAYPLMDFDSRQLYRDAISDLAPHTRMSEVEIARRAVLCASKATRPNARPNQRATERRRNVGYYLLSSGASILKGAIGYHPTLTRKIKEIVLDWPEVYYVAGVELTTLVMIYLLLRDLGVLIPLIPALLLLIPASQAAVGLMNHLTAWILPPRRLARLDFSDGIPAEFRTLVVVPSLLLNEREVRHIVEALEVRFLGNRDHNLQFALLTDSPDASSPSDERHELVRLCGSLVDQLNTKYAQGRPDIFFHLHRNHVFNPQENTWMGWERKRGKLLDLNRLLLNSADNFPIKTGDVSHLRGVRYVITLDSDTRLPREAAFKLVGTLAHPLNRAVIDRQTNTVVEGYGILQPRVGVSIESAHKSRLASIYSGETGIDIYSRAVSDVYQDLFGEGSFTGKGIYEVKAFQRALDNRFPSNTLLSHDLIEGTYARAGLVSDIEVIDDYPSHFSAYCRRMHRWVRGDWQILRWLFPKVPDFSGKKVPNPLPLLSRWKIFDNLRRSLIELNLLVLLLAGWFLFPGSALYWTMLTLGLLLIPTYVQLLFSLLRIRHADNLKVFLRERANDFVTGHLQVFVMLVLLPQKAFVLLDAIIRTLARLTLTHRNLLEWETAAEAEGSARRKSAVEIYLALTPWFALAAGILLFAFRPAALPAAIPVLVLWQFATVFAWWMNRPPRRRDNQLAPEENTFLRTAALATWRFFREFSNAGNNWLIPDRVQESPAAVVHTLSPTNLGMLLNARLAAHRLGYLTLAEFIGQTEETLRSAKRLPRFKGHFLNWYDIQTHQPLPPKFVSTVDSGNLAASLLALKQGCLAMIQEPLLAPQAWQGICDHITFLTQLLNGKTPPIEIVGCIQELQGYVKNTGTKPSEWVAALPRLQQELRDGLAAVDIMQAESANGQPGPMSELVWWMTETLARTEKLQRLTETLAPWLLPEYRPLVMESSTGGITLNSLPDVVAQLQEHLDGAVTQDSGGPAAETRKTFRSRLNACARNAEDLAARLRQLAEEADELFHAMDFRFLYHRKRKLFSIGYDVETGEYAKSCYDLLATEARTATLLAIAKGDVGQEAWFRLGRSPATEHGKTSLLSWSGTLFEYLMPLIWMRSYPGTLLDNTVFSAVQCQKRHTKKKGVPWGISEAAFSVQDDGGLYQYRAFGLAGLAQDPDASSELVIAPYATFLALMVDAPLASGNLKVMHEKGWLGRFGFYESADYSNASMSTGENYELVRCWMAHHQGMSLLAACNLQCRSVLQQWFHQDPLVMATELLLHEKASMATPEETSPATDGRLFPLQRKVETFVRNVRLKPGREGRRMFPAFRLAGESTWQKPMPAAPNLPPNEEDRSPQT